MQSKRGERDIEEFLVPIEDDRFVISECLKPNHLRLKTLDMCLSICLDRIVKNQDWISLVELQKLEV